MSRQPVYTYTGCLMICEKLRKKEKKKKTLDFKLIIWGPHTIIWGDHWDNEGEQDMGTAPSENNSMLIHRDHCTMQSRGSGQQRAPKTHSGTKLTVNLKGALGPFIHS